MRFVQILFYVKTQVESYDYVHKQ